MEKAIIPPKSTFSIDFKGEMCIEINGWPFLQIHIYYNKSKISNLQWLKTDADGGVGKGAKK